MWGRWIIWCVGTRKQWWWTVQSVALLQEVISYAVKQYCLKLENCILEGIYLHHRDDVLLAPHQVLN
jgi:hypothetical protein